MSLIKGSYGKCRINSLDSGTGTNIHGARWWATSEYIQNIQVVETASDEFCATVTSQGSFESVGGEGPGCTGELECGLLEAGVVGTFQGGLTITFPAGEFNIDGLRTRGSIGTLDADCNESVKLADDPCPGGGFYTWMSDYFGITKSDASFLWWGWVYHAGNNGSWVNSSDGNEGNITGN